MPLTALRHSQGAAMILNEYLAALFTPNDLQGGVDDIHVIFDEKWFTNNFEKERINLCLRTYKSAIDMVPDWKPTKKEWEEIQCRVNNRVCRIPIIPLIENQYLTDELHSNKSNSKVRI